ncbi:MAG: aryl-sulfate sulfotransferase [Deltaproteobacteria bacterium]|nr:aryl-sulfate sulfotransferase [Deltaproteobacteria bacterium]
MSTARRGVPGSNPMLAVLASVLVGACGGGSAGPAPIRVEELFGEVVLNPTSNTPLCAEVVFRPVGDTVVTVAVAGPTEGEGAFSAELAVTGTAAEVRLPILGLFPAHDNRVSFTVREAGGREVGTHVVTLTTGPLPADFPAVTAAGTHDEGSFTFVEWLRTQMSRPEVVGIMVDARGRVRWYSAFPIPTLHPMEIFDGTMYAGDAASLLLRYDFLGHEIGRADLGQHGYQRIHHDIFLKPDGNVLLTADLVGAAFIEDRVIEIDPVANNLRARWNLADTLPDVAGLFMDVPLTSMAQPGITNDPIHNNALWYDESDDTLIACSQRTGVAKLYRGGQLKWLLAPHLVRWIDDADGDGVSDSLVDGYDPGNQLTWLSDFGGPAFTDERYPVNGKPTTDYSGFDFDYGEFLLEPLDAAGLPITDEAVRRGFADHPEFAWPFRPHSARLAANGNLLVFDNGLGRNFGLPFGPQAYSRAVEYEIAADRTDGYGGTVRQVWEYRLTADPPWHALSVLVSNANELPGGTRLVTSGAIGSSFIQGTILGTYDGPIGALVIEVDPRDNSELHWLRFDRVVDALHPPPEFSVYRAGRVDPYAYWRGRSLGAP